MLTTDGRRLTRKQLVAAGLCRNYYCCGNARGGDGTKLECRPCARVRNRKNADTLNETRHDWDAEGLCLGCGAERDNRTKRCNVCRTLKAISDGARHHTASPTRP
jgi:hypothetical protein